MAARVGLVATTAPWSAALRSYVRDHSRGASVEVVLDRPGLEAAVANLDVLVVDDTMRTFSIYDIARAQSFGVRVVAVVDPLPGPGRQYVDSLGVDQVLPASLPPAELLAAALEAVAPGRDQRALHHRSDGARRDEHSDGLPPRHKRVGWVCAWTKATGGAGLTEAVIAAAVELSKRYRVLLVEAEELAPVLLSRLCRLPDGGLPWALSRAGQGLDALPDAVSPPGPGAPAGADRFDVVCAASTAAYEINPAQLDKFLAEASAGYDYVLVETSWLLGASSARERFGAARAVLRKAACIVALASADPEGAGRLVQWKATALGLGVGAPTFAAFGRASTSRYETEQLRSLIEANTGRQPFEGVAFLPVDERVGRARWNADVVRKGPFRDAVGALAARTAAVASGLGAVGEGGLGAKTA